MYAGRARFTDDGGQRHDVGAELEEIRDGEWAGILSGPLDWESFMGDKHLVLELASDGATDLPLVSLVHVDLAVGERAGAHGEALVEHLDEPVLVTSGARRRGLGMRATRSPRAIHWHDDH